LGHKPGGDRCVAGVFGITLGQASLFPARLAIKEQEGDHANCQADQAAGRNDQPNHDGQHTGVDGVPHVLVEAGGGELAPFGWNRGWGKGRAQSKRRYCHNDEPGKEEDRANGVYPAWGGPVIPGRHQNKGDDQYGLGGYERPACKVLVHKRKG